MNKVYVVHEHGVTERSTILYVGTDGQVAAQVAHAAFVVHQTNGRRYMEVDVADMELNKVPEERNITLKVSKSELEDLLVALGRNDGADLAAYIRESCK